MSNLWPADRSKPASSRSRRLARSDSAAAMKHLSRRSGERHQNDVPTRDFSLATAVLVPNEHPTGEARQSRQDKHDVTTGVPALNLQVTNGHCIRCLLFDLPGFR